MVSRPPTEEELVERARRGDGAAFGALVRDEEEIAFRTAYLITRNAADAEDAAQAALVKAFYALPRFRRGAPLRPWLLAIVANEARNRRRSGGRREALALRAAHELPSGGAAPSPEGKAPRDGGTRRAAGGARGARRGRSARPLVPLPPRPERSRDGRGALPPPRNRQVAHLPRARPTARRSSEANGDRARAPSRRPPRGDRAPGDAAARGRVERAVAQAHPRRRARPRRRSLRPFAVALAVVLVAALGVLAFSPGARSAFLELFDIRGASVSRVEQLPEVAPIERAELLGVRVPLAKARRQAGFELAGLGEPDAVYLRGDGLRHVVYGSIERPRLLLSQVRGNVWDGFVKKVGAREPRSRRSRSRASAASSSRASRTSSCTATRTA